MRYVRVKKKKKLIIIKVHYTIHYMITVLKNQTSMTPDFFQKKKAPN